MIEAFLYPQTTLYPPGLLKFFPHLKKLYLLDLETPKDIYNSLIPELREKIQFVKRDEKYREIFQRVLLYTERLKSFGEYLRYPENLRYYQLHRDLFEEHFCLTRRDDIELDPIERALIVLLLAEEIDRCYFEVSLGLKKFMAEWKKFFDEKILFHEGLSSEVGELDEPSDFEFLLNVYQRKKAFECIFNLYIWESIKDVDTLLITDKTIISDIIDEISPIERITLDELILLFRLPEPINRVLGFPVGQDHPQFSNILTFS